MHGIARRDFVRLLPGLTLASSPLQGLRCGTVPITSPSSLKSEYSELITEWLDTGSFPYDQEYFETSERVLVLGTSEPGSAKYYGIIDLIPRLGIRLDIKVVIAASRNRLKSKRRLLFKQQGVAEPIIIRFPLDAFDSELIWYRVFYRSSKGKYKALTPKCFRNPITSADIAIGVISDPHCPDDCDKDEFNFRIYDERLRELRLNGNYVNEFIKNLMENPEWEPEGEAKKLGNGFNLASIYSYILRNIEELKYDFLINLGDVAFIQEYRYEGMGLPLGTLRKNARELWLSARRRAAAITPIFPYYLVLGNHEGEEERNPAKKSARRFRKLFWHQPGSAQKCSPDENYYSIIWGAHGELQIIVLDSDSYHTSKCDSPDMYTLGKEQMSWFKRELKKERWFKAVFLHHVLGGWPANPVCDSKGAYGRGPEFTSEDYLRLNLDPRSIEQVRITRLAKKNGISLFCYGHDHVWFRRCIGENSNNKPIYAVCCGSAKHYADPWDKNDVDGFNYWENSAYGSASERRFLGPPGMAEIRIQRSGIVNINYICAAKPHETSNMPKNANIGDVQDGFTLYL